MHNYYVCFGFDNFINFVTNRTKDLNISFYNIVVKIIQNFNCRIVNIMVIIIINITTGSPFIDFRNINHYYSYYSLVVNTIDYYIINFNNSMLSFMHITNNFDFGLYGSMK